MLVNSLFQEIKQMLRENKGKVPKRERPKGKKRIFVKSNNKKIKV